MRETSVQGHYGRAGLDRRILAALTSAGKDVDALLIEDLAPIDHLHGRGRAATEELFHASGFRPGMRVLDVGCGIGGPARYLAAKGLLVAAVDLTPEFCEAARELNRRTGLSKRVSIAQASALDLSFADRSFDGVWMQHVNMNIRDKAALVSELVRVLRPGGRVAMHEVFAGGRESPHFPTPWASTPESSFLCTQSRFRRLLEARGLSVERWKDDTEATARFFADAFKRLETSGRPPLGPHLLFGESFEAIFRNFARSLCEGRCTVALIVATKTA